MALSRGINVGGRDVIPMTGAAPRLRGARPARRHQLHRQRQRPASDSGLADARTLASRLERALSKDVGYQATVVLRSHYADEDGRPARARGFRRLTASYRYDVAFVKGSSLAPRAIVPSISTREGVEIRPARRARASSTSPADPTRSQSHLPGLVSLPAYPAAHHPQLEHDDETAGADGHR